MAPTVDGATGDEVGDKRFVFAGTPITNVSTRVEGLHGRTRLAALAAAEGLQGTPNVGNLDARLRSAAAEIGAAAAAWGDEVAIEVSPGAERGSICVAFRPPFGSRVSVDAGLDAQMDTALQLRAEQTVVSDGARPPSLASGLLSLGQDGIKGTISAMPQRLSGSQWTPSVEMTTQHVNITQWRGPYQKAQLMGVSLKEESGQHAVRLEAALREIVPDQEASQAVWHSPLCSTKSTISYEFLSDKPHASGAPQLRRGSVGLSGLFGDVALGRAEGAWSCKWPLRLPWSGTLTTAAGVGLLIPLGAETPLPDRFFLGGSLGGLVERLPGYAYRGVGPTDLRKASASRDYLGGNARASASAVFQWPLPQLPVAWGLEGVRLQGMLFGSAGTLVDKVRPSLVQDLVRQLRGSVGIGIGAPLPQSGFLGITLAQPVLARPSDAKQRLQVWLSFGSLL